jgi:ribosomal protein L29
LYTASGFGTEAPLAWKYCIRKKKQFFQGCNLDLALQRLLRRNIAFIKTILVEACYLDVALKRLLRRLIAFIKTILFQGCNLDVVLKHLLCRNIT